MPDQWMMPEKFWNPVPFSRFWRHQSCAGSQFIAPRHLQMRIAHMIRHTSTRGLAHLFWPADHGSGHTRNSDPRWRIQRCSDSIAKVSKSVDYIRTYHFIDLLPAHMLWLLISKFCDDQALLKLMINDYMRCRKKGFPLPCRILRPPFYWPA